MDQTHRGDAGTQALLWCLYLTIIWPVHTMFPNGSVLQPFGPELGLCIGTQRHARHMAMCPIHVMQAPELLPEAKDTADDVADDIKDAAPDLMHTATLIQP